MLPPRLLTFPRASWARWLLPMLAAASLSFAQESATGPAGAVSFKRGVNVSHWLSQNAESRPYAAPWFTEEDVAWIAKQGFDHIRYPIDGRVWLRDDGSLDESKITPFDEALRWTRQHGLGAILDMHFLPGASFDPDSEDRAAFTDRALQEKVAAFWRRVATRFAKEGDYLRFEILNEPIAEDNRQLNPFNERMLAAIRESNPTRVVYITSNHYGSFQTVNDLVVPDDPHVAITLHFYEPMVFTHQRASWTRFPDDMPKVEFPGTVPNLAKSLPADHWGRSQSGRQLTVAQIDEAFAKVAAWAEQQAPGREIYLGEFGAYDRAPAESRRNYVAAVTAAAERHGWSWAVWDYQGGFAVRDQKGRPTPILKGLFQRK